MRVYDRSIGLRADTAVPKSRGKRTDGGPKISNTKVHVRGLIAWVERVLGLGRQDSDE